MAEEANETQVVRESLDDFIRRVHQKAIDNGLASATLKDADVYTRATLNALSDVLVDHKSFTILNAFSLLPVFYEERMGHNPQNPGETITIPAQWKPKFKASKELRRRMNGR